MITLLSLLISLVSTKLSYHQHSKAKITIQKHLRNFEILAYFKKFPGSFISLTLNIPSPPIINTYQLQSIKHPKPKHSISKTPYSHHHLNSTPLQQTIHILPPPPALPTHNTPQHNTNSTTARKAPNQTKPNPITHSIHIPLNQTQESIHLSAPPVSLQALALAHAHKVGRHACIRFPQIMGVWIPSLCIPSFDIPEVAERSLAK